MAQQSDSHEVLGGTVRGIGSGGTDFCEFASRPKVILLQPVRYFGGLLLPTSQFDEAINIDKCPRLLSVGYG
jgi:hypothetical protein